MGGHTPLGLHWKLQQKWFREAERHDSELVEERMGEMVAAYVWPPSRCRVICIDELRPLAAKMYPGEEYVLGARRATFEPDCGRRGKLWVHGAFEPGAAALVSSGRRDSKSRIRPLEHMVERFPPERWLVTSWLNLIESRWKQLKALALKGRRFDMIT